MLGVKVGQPTSLCCFSNCSVIHVETSFIDSNVVTGPSPSCGGMHGADSTLPAKLVPVCRDVRAAEFDLFRVGPAVNQAPR